MKPLNCCRCAGDRDRGQATIALVGVILVLCVLGLAISILAQAMVHRARARTAADAVALAGAADQNAAGPLIARYRDQGIVVEHDGMSAIARSGPAQAMAWAENSAATDQPAPALVAIMARAEQLTGSVFDEVRWSGIAVELSGGDAGLLRLVAGELGLCEGGETESRSGWTVFELC